MHRVFKSQNDLNIFQATHHFTDSRLSMTIFLYMTDVQGMDKIMETLDSIGIKLLVLAA
jgi:hypothetical protein